MATAVDYFGYRYDDTHPAFIVFPTPPHPLAADGSDKLVYHRPTGRFIDYEGLEAAMTAQGYTPGAKEIGPDDEWLRENTQFLGLPSQGGLTFDIRGGGSKELVIAVEGVATAPVGFTLQGLTVDGVTGSGARWSTVFPTGTTAEQAAASIQAGLNSRSFTDGTTTIVLTAAVDGTTVKVLNNHSPGIYAPEPTVLFTPVASGKGLNITWGYIGAGTIEVRVTGGPTTAAGNVNVAGLSFGGVALANTPVAFASAATAVTIATAMATALNNAALATTPASTVLASRNGAVLTITNSAGLNADQTLAVTVT